MRVLLFCSVQLDVSEQQRARAGPATELIEQLSEERAKCGGKISINMCLAEDQRAEREKENQVNDLRNFELKERAI